VILKDKNMGTTMSAEEFIEYWKKVYPVKK
jgi:hypothetical protein